jgi:hypothetical protein
MAKQHIPGPLAFPRALPITPADLRPEIRWRGLSVHWVCCEGLSGSCDETVTGVKPPYRARSRSRISSLAAIARRIADDRALKAPVVVFGCASAGDAAGLPAVEILR